ncbi:SusC/RagA family TonB-linked outer membrane protein [Salinimicrobium sp. MT39]|uniref:SusC/RagA family TonB-linked outer membrane protein n=1 Tax=Salinimicrobium profundisediminis TaxID=2994553 RepID=A0A9X3I0Z3_9FLAO|nr:SusC/RagA family TonB-linked outer membrane protein [Salinimicrobium profundisediminis]MCX2838535.1 SusC/RagA family TonB-linked outer membrane protein [Salinimicrobium profundisediminis]
MKIKLFILFGFALGLFSQNMVAQDQAISGTITDAQNGMPLPGVTVVEKGTMNGAVTDMDGNYMIDVPSDAVLVFSMVGFTTREITVGDQSTIDVQLTADVQALEEVVVTALGIKRETKKLGYAMSEVEGGEISKTNTVSPVRGLQGKVAGVSIGSSDGGLFGNSKIQIRGISSLNSNNNQPIFVIDGVILENSVADEAADWSASANDYGNILKNLNPDNYESVSVLKGAAATALYGSRGINGVVIIQTKDGSGARGLGVTVSQTVGIEDVYRQPALQNEFGPGTLPGYVGYGRQDSNGDYYRFSPEFYYNTDGDPTLINHAGGGLSYGPRFDSSVMIEDYDGNLIPYVANEDNMKDAYDTGWNSNTHFAIKGGNEKATFYLSDSYSYRTGVLPNNSFDRNTLAFRASYEVAPWLKANGSVTFTQSESKNARNDFSEIFASGGFERIYNTKKYSQRRYWQAEHGGIPNSDYGDEYAYAPNAGLWFSFNTANAVQEETVVRPVVSLSASLTDWLTLAVEGNMNYYTTRFEDKNLGSGLANEGGGYELNHTRNVSRTGKITLNANTQINEDFSAQVLLGGEIWDQEKSQSNVRTDGGLVFPGKFFIDNSKRDPIGFASVFGTKQINSLYFLTSFGYQDQVFLDITGRNDWSSALVYTDGTGNNSYFYPSVSTSWIFDQTFEMPEWVTFGKLRASWAQVGSDTDPYLINPGYQIGSFEMENGNFVPWNNISTTLVDRSIEPERKNSFEIGADLRFLENRIGLDVAYYDETIKNQIGSVPIPRESGYNNLFTNVGTLKNYGLELSLTVDPIRTENFRWRSTFNYWNNTTKVTELHEDYGEYKVLGGYTNYGNYRIGSVAFEGGEYGVLMSDSSKKLWQSTDANGNPIDDPRNGMPILKYSDANRGAVYTRSGVVEEIGKIQPDFEGSWSNEFSYKGLTLSVLLDARFGGHIASYSSKYGTAYGYLEESLEGRAPEYGGVTWTSEYADTQGQVFEDGIIPEGVFSPGQSITAPDGTMVNVGGMTFQEAFDQGYVEPTHAGYYHYFNNAWSSGVVNDDWFTELEYIALRNISIGYNFPSSISDKIKAQNLYIGLNGHNLAYLHNSLPNDIHPEGFRGTTSSSSFLERSFTPYTASYSMTVSIDF